MPSHSSLNLGLSTPTFRYPIVVVYIVKQLRFSGSIYKTSISLFFLENETSNPFWDLNMKSSHPNAMFFFSWPLLAFETGLKSIVPVSPCTSSKGLEATRQLATATDRRMLNGPSSSSSGRRKINGCEPVLQATTICIVPRTRFAPQSQSSQSDPTIILFSFNFSKCLLDRVATPATFSPGSM